MTSAPQLTIPPAALRYHRLKAVLTQEELADASGVSVARIRDIERGKNTVVQPGTVTKLAAALKCSKEALIHVTAEGVA